MLMLLPVAICQKIFHACVSFDFVCAVYALHLCDPPASSHSVTVLAQTWHVHSKDKTHWHMHKISPSTSYSMFLHAEVLFRSHGADSGRTQWIIYSIPTSLKMKSEDLEKETARDIQKPISAFIKSARTNISFSFRKF